MRNNPCVSERSKLSHSGTGTDPYHEYDERAAGRMMLGTIVFGVVIGTGVGVFYEQPWIGAAIGAAIGIVAGLWLVPRLLRDWD